MLLLAHNIKADNETLKHIGKDIYPIVFEGAPPPCFKILTIDKTFPFLPDMEIYVWTDGYIAWLDVSKEFGCFFATKISSAIIQDAKDKLKKYLSHINDQFLMDSTKIFDSHNSAIIDQYCMYFDDIYKCEKWYPFFLDWYEKHIDTLKEENFTNIINIVKSSTGYYNIPYNILASYRHVDVFSNRKFSDTEIYDCMKQLNIDVGYAFLMKQLVFDMLHQNRNNFVSTYMPFKSFSIIQKNEGEKKFIYNLIGREYVYPMNKVSLFNKMKVIQKTRVEMNFRKCHKK